MRRTKTTAIRTEIVEQQIVSFRPRVADSVLFCPQCRAGTAWLSLANAASNTKLSLAEIFRLADDGKLHSQITPDGHILVCNRSLEKMGDSSELKVVAQKQKNG